MIDSDYWFSRIVTLCRGVPQFVSSTPQIDRDRTCREIAEELNAIFDSVDVETGISDGLERRLEEFLNLPMWKQRHEIYSVWVGCQLADVLGESRIVLHPVSGELSFSFKGVHLGTWRRDPIPLYLWCEVRSPLDKPRGVGRKKAIQPDYRAIPAPMSSPELCELVVECKQYWVGDAQGFADAVSDYARGCPQAQVILVNYGTIPATAVDLIDDDVVDRVALIAHFRPDREEGKRDFAEFVGKAIIAPEAAFPFPVAASTYMKEVVTVTLRWGSTPRDLDLHIVAFLPSAQDVDVSFPLKGKMTPIGAGSAIYHQDVTSGGGPERIDLIDADRGLYVFYVHRYSSDGMLSGCRAEVTLNIGGQDRGRWVCPNGQTGRSWYVFALLVEQSGTRLLELHRITDAIHGDMVKEIN